MFQRKFTALLISAAMLSIAGCDDPHAAQRQALGSELQQVEAMRSQSLEALAARTRRIAELQDQLSSQHSEHVRYASDVQSFMLNHKAAVAAIAAGAAGAQAALRDDGSVGQQAREIGAMVGLAALTYALFNADEVTSVAAELMKDDSVLDSMTRQEQATSDALAAEQNARVAAQGRCDELDRRAAQVRTALASA